MKTHRLSSAAWKLLQQLGQDTAALAFSPADGKFYFTLNNEVVDLVRPSTIDALSAAGMIRRERATNPWYSITDRGSETLRQCPASC